MIEIKAYKCDCGKKFFTPLAAKKHEISCKCWTNPKWRTCKTCKFGKQVWDSMGDEEHLSAYKQWECGNPDFNYDMHFTAAHENAPDLCINCPIWVNKKQQHESKNYQ